MEPLQEHGMYSGSELSSSWHTRQVRSSAESLTSSDDEAPLLRGAGAAGSDAAAPMELLAVDDDMMLGLDHLDRTSRPRNGQEMFLK